MVVLALLTLTGCLSYSRTKGAKPLEPGQVSFMLSGALRPAETGLGLPIPEGGAANLRFGLREDLDFGIDFTVLGGGVDIRHRFFHQGRWHLALAPRLAAVSQTNLIAPSEVFTFEVEMPLIAEVELNDWASLSGGVQMNTRQHMNVVSNGRVWRFDPRMGMGLRFQAQRRRFFYGLSGDIYTNPIAKRPHIVAGLDLSYRTRTKAEAKEHQERRKARKARRKK